MQHKHTKLTYVVTEYQLQGFTIRDTPIYKTYKHSEHDTEKEAQKVCDRFNELHTFTDNAFHIEMKKEPIIYDDGSNDGDYIPF